MKQATVLTLTKSVGNVLLHNYGTKECNQCQKAQPGDHLLLYFLDVGVGLVPDVHQLPEGPVLGHYVIGLLVDG